MTKTRPLTVVCFCDIRLLVVYFGSFELDSLALASRVLKGFFRGCIVVLQIKMRHT
jgi:hypothetical protein